MIASSVDPAEELEQLGVAAARQALADHPPGDDVERGTGYGREPQFAEIHVSGSKNGPEQILESLVAYRRRISDSGH